MDTKELLWILGVVIFPLLWRFFDMDRKFATKTEVETLRRQIERLEKKIDMLINKLI